MLFSKAEEILDHWAGTPATASVSLTFKSQPSSFLALLDLNLTKQLFLLSLASQEIVITAVGLRMSEIGELSLPY